MSAVLAGSLLLTPSHAHADDIDRCVSAAETSLTLRKQQLLLEARDKLVECAAPKCPTEVRAECERRLADLGAALPSIVLAARDEKGVDLTDVRVTLDGKPLTERLDGTTIALNPGAHTLRLEAAGRTPVTHALVVREGEKRRAVGVVLESLRTTTPAAEGDRKSTRLNSSHRH